MNIDDINEYTRNHMQGYLNLCFGSELLEGFGEGILLEKESYGVKEKSPLMGFEGSFPSLVHGRAGREQNLARLESEEGRVWRVL